MTGAYDVAVIGGGPSGATAADDLARAGRRVLLLDRAGRIKPCGGAIPPRAIRDFAIPDDLIVGKATSARMVAPSAEAVDMAVGGYVGMVDREVFDEWLRARAARSGASRLTGRAERIERDDAGPATIVYRDAAGAEQRVRARTIIAADGARSRLASAEVKGGDKPKCVFAYHEIIRAPAPDCAGDFAPARADVYYQGALSPDFYAWIFPHGETASVGVGSARKGFGLRESVTTLRRTTGLDTCETVRGEGAPIPLKPLRRWDNGRDLVLAGDAAGVVAPASGEGIYYAMLGGRLAAEAVEAFLATGRPRALGDARRRFMREHGKVFWVLGMMQHFWYKSDKRRERFVRMCADKDVQRLTWQAYMEKKLVRAGPAAHARIFFKDMRHLLGSMGVSLGATWLADMVLLAMAVELVLLVAAGRDPRAVLRALLPGALLALALRAALAGAGGWVAPLLALSLPFHLAELRARLDRPPAIARSGRRVHEGAGATPRGGARMERLMMKRSLVVVGAGMLLGLAAPALAKDITVKMNTKGAGGTSYVFEPAFVKAAVGDKVHFVPSDPTHNAETINGMLPAGVAASKGPMGKEFVLTLTKPGLYGVECLPHYSMGMVGLVQAGAGPSPNLAAAKAMKLPPLAGKRMTPLLAQAS